MSRGEAVVSAVLAVDTLETGEECIEALGRQTIADALELVLAGPGLEVPAGLAARFHGLRTVEAGVESLAEARAAGILATTAPSVFVAETHALPEPACLELLVRELDAGADAAVPRFANANPEKAASWASLFATYGGFTGPRAVQPGAVVLHNGAFRRELLERVIRRDPLELVYGIGLSRLLAAEGRRRAYVPDAVVRHLNVARAAALVRDRFGTSRMWAGHRARAWSPARRLAYLAGSPLIPLAFLVSVLRSDGWQAHRRAVPHGTLAVLALSTLPIAAGEAVGYAAGPGRPSAAHTRVELHRDEYV